MRKIILTTILYLILSISVASANSLRDIQDDIGVDKFAHFGIGYVVSNELQHAGMSKFEAMVTVAFLSYAKEKWVDDEFSKSDITATVLGSVIPLYHKEF